MEIEKFKINTGENEFITGLFEKPQEIIKGTAVLMHGRRSSKDSTSNLELTRLCQENNFQVFRFDFRGHGESSNSPNWNKFGVLDQEQDLEQVIRYLHNENLIKKPLILIASSFAAESALIYTSKNKEAKALILVSPGLGKNSSGTNNNQNRVKWWNKNITTTQISFEDYKIALQKIKQPVYILHGSEDESVPVDQSDELKLLIGENVKIFSIKDGKHKFTETEEAKNERIKIISELISS